MSNIYIFDLDGTLALIDHRQPILDDTSLSTDERWRKFFAACVDDEPNLEVVTLLHLLHEDGRTIWVWSARSDEVKEQTLTWFEEWDIPVDAFRFRKADDRRPDVQLKEEWLLSLEPYDRNNLCAVFDDRDSVVAMWRKHGITCFQVAPGNF